MKTKKSFKELAKSIELLKEDQQGKLKGGFTTVSTSMRDIQTSNNCLGGDCAAGCSIGEGLSTN